MTRARATDRMGTQTPDAHSYVKRRSMLSSAPKPTASLLFFAASVYKEGRTARGRRKSQGTT